MKIFAWGVIGDMECIIANSPKESWDMLSQDWKDYFEEYDESHCIEVDVIGGKFNAYHIWEI